MKVLLRNYHNHFFFDHLHSNDNHRMTAAAFITFRTMIAMILILATPTTTTKIVAAFASSSSSLSYSSINNLHLATKTRRLMTTSVAAAFTSSSSSSSPSSSVTTGTKQPASRKIMLVRNSLTKRRKQTYPAVSVLFSTSERQQQELSSSPSSLTSSSENSNIVTDHNDNRMEGENNNNTDGSNNIPQYDELFQEIGINRNELKHVQFMSHHPLQVKYDDIFCNRDLKFNTVKAIGFDMDYTLVQYKQPSFDKLAFDGAKIKLYTNYGYPKEVLHLQYNHTIWKRGLIIDTLRGNFLKIDRHKYVRVAYHGFNVMSSVTRKYLYSRQFNKVISFSEKHYVNLDTLFQFVDAHLFALLIEMKDEGKYPELNLLTYEEIYKQIREAIDLCHRDGVIKNEVHRNPDKYIVLDHNVIPMLRNYRRQGIKTFLLTNSLWEYTSTAMNYLYHQKRVSDEEQKTNDWMELFDLIIVGSCKPAYMLDPYLNLFRVHPATGLLQNTDGIYEINSLGENGAQEFLAKGKTFQGGNWLHLQAMLQIKAGEEILYVGDHLYSDVLRSKRTLGWRSCFIMPELHDEMVTYHHNVKLIQQISLLRQLRDDMGKYYDRYHCQYLLSKENNDDNDDNSINGVADHEGQLQKVFEEIKHEDVILKRKLTELTSQWHEAFHPVWGAMFLAGYQDSRFAFYVSNYACLYTSKASNLVYASSMRSFRASMESLPHDRMLLLSSSSSSSPSSHSDDDDNDDDGTSNIDEK